MTEQYAILGADIFDGGHMHKGKALLLVGEAPHIAAPGDLPTDIPSKTMSGGTILPAFVDLQVNGGGGVMFNDAPSPKTLEHIAKAHAGLGTNGILATLITDTPNHTAAAVDAVRQAIDEKIPGIIGLHLEGPHLSQARKGAHDGNKIRPMQDDDMAVLLQATNQIANLMITVAPENTTTQQVADLTSAGAIISLGHSDCDYDTARAYFEAGARCSTHLFNAMSPLTSRAPGLVGASIDIGQPFAGLIADAVHVHPATIRAALAAKNGPGDVFLVSDAMACAGSDITSFSLNGRMINRRDGRLTLADGTLAGADLELARAIKVMVEQVGDTPEMALARATSIPAKLLREDFGLGRWPDTKDGLIYLDADYDRARSLPAL